MSFIKVTGVDINDRRINVRFVCSNELEQYFVSNKVFWSDYDYDLTDLPLSVALVPFVCNMLPIVWLTNSELILPEIDADFFKSIPNFLRGYGNMYPMLKFRGRVLPKKLAQNKPRGDKYYSGVFFSGGVDAFCTLFRHLSEHPVLITIWGADVRLKDINGWNNVSEHVQSTASEIGCDFTFVKTNFRTYIDESKCSELISGSNENFWHGFQHGIGLLGQAAPLVWKYGINKLYIASSYTADDVGHTCASDPSIDNFVRFCGAEIVHDGFELTRQNKIHYICEFANKNNIKPILRVCWQSTGGKNCCNCEKCMRTIFEILVEGRHPQDFGLKYCTRHLRNSRFTVLSDYSKVVKPAWNEIQRLMNSLPEGKVIKYTDWVKNCDFESESKGMDIKLRRFINNLPWRLYRKIRSQFNRIANN